MRRIMVFIDEIVLKDLKGIAARKNRPVSRVIREALDLYVKQWKRKHRMDMDKGESTGT